MKLNIPIILYLLFLVLVCMNKPKVIEGAIFFSSPSNCPVVDRVLNRANNKYNELCSETVSTPSPTECAIASPILNFIRNEYNYVCKNLEPPGPNNAIIQGGEGGEDGGGDETVPPEDVSRQK